MNPMQMLKGIKNPQEAVKMLMKGNTNPILNNLLEKAEKGDSKGIETFARNFFKEQGRDFDVEFQQFMSNFR